MAKLKPRRPFQAHDVISTTGPVATVYRCGTCKATLHIAKAGYRSYADYGKAVGIRAKHTCKKVGA